MAKNGRPNWRKAREAKFDCDLFSVHVLDENEIFSAFLPVMRARQKFWERTLGYLPLCASRYNFRPSHKSRCEPLQRPLHTWGNMARERTLLVWCLFEYITEVCIWRTEAARYSDWRRFLRQECVKNIALMSRSMRRRWQAELMCNIFHALSASEIYCTQ